MCTTSIEAYDLGQRLIEEYRRRKDKELKKKSNLPSIEKKKPAAASAPKDGPSRTVTNIDYKKHERTVEELEAQEKEEKLAQKRLQEANRPPVGGCSHDHQKEWAIYEKSTEEKIRAADRFREEGNEAFKKLNYGLAAVHYRKALLQFDYTFADTPEEEKWLEDVKLRCLINLAACKVQQEDWDEVLTQCRLALEINPRSVKAYYRTGQAHLARDNFDMAREALINAYEIEPHNKEVLGALQNLKKKVADYKEKTRDVAEAMVHSAEAEEVVTPVTASGIKASEEPITEGAPEAAGPATSSKLGTAQAESEFRQRNAPRLSEKAAAVTTEERGELHKDDDDNDDAVLDPAVQRKILLLVGGLATVAAICIAVALFVGE